MINIARLMVRIPVTICGINNKVNVPKVLVDCAIRFSVDGTIANSIDTPFTAVAVTIRI